MNKLMDLEKATAQSAIFFLFFFWKKHICALCIVFPGVFFNLCFLVSETQQQKALSPSSVLTGPFHTLAAPQSLPGDRWQCHKDNTGGCRPPGGEMLSHTKISWSHGREVKNRATGEGGIMKRWVKIANESGNEENIWRKIKASSSQWPLKHFYGILFWW